MVTRTAIDLTDRDATKQALEKLTRDSAVRILREIHARGSDGRYLDDGTVSWVERELVSYAIRATVFSS